MWICPGEALRPPRSKLKRISKMPRSSDFPFPRRYNSLRLIGFDYTSQSSLYFITMNTDSSRPVFGDLQFAKTTIGSLLDPRTTARMRVHAYSLLPDHLHLLASVRELGKSISALLGAFKSYTTQQYWKRGQRSLSGNQSHRRLDRFKRAHKRKQGLFSSL